jgi:Asp-tRNA(Asn)/Glu-tRNA(Gln) amidotransferase A subunit family amidase
MRHIPRTINESNKLGESQAPHNSEDNLLRGRRESNLAFKVYGIAAISIPSGFTKQVLPAGLMIASANGCESGILAVAHAYEQITSGRR